MRNLFIGGDLLSKNMFFLTFLFFNFNYWSQDIIESQYSNGYYQKNKNVTIYGDTNENGVKVVLNKNGKLISIEGFENGIKNGYSFYYKGKNSLEYSYFDNGVPINKSKSNLDIHIIKTYDSLKKWSVKIENLIGFGTVISIHEDNFSVMSLITFRENKLDNTIIYDNKKNQTIKLFKKGKIVSEKKIMIQS